MFEVRGSRGPVVRNKANLRPPGGIGGVSPTLHAGTIAPNKPNSARPAGRRGPWEGQSCQTKPVGGPIVQNEPNSGQLASPETSCTNKANFPAGPIVRHRLDTPLRETKPIRGGQGAPLSQHPIIPAFQPAAGCAKQTQFRPSEERDECGFGRGGPAISPFCGGPDA